MINRANVKEAVLSLWSTKQRSLLALIGILVGIGSVIAMVSVGTIVQHEALRQFREMGTDILSVAKESGGDTRRSGGPGISLDMARGIPRFCSQVDVVAPYSSVFGTLKYRGQKFDAPALGVTGTFMDLNKLTLLQGRFISDLDHFMYFCVAGAAVQQKLSELGVKQTIGTKIIYMDKQFTIVGTVAYAPPTNMRPYEVSAGIMIPLSTSRRLGQNEGIRSILARMTPDGDHLQAADEIRRYFEAEAGGLTVRVQSAEELIAQMQKQMRMFTLLLGVIGSISLVVGGVGVMNVMLVSVTERRKEIGIRRALGARRKDIQGQFLVESIFLCLAGGLLGVLLGLVVSFVIARFSNWQFFVSHTAVVLGVLVSAAVGLFFGYYPARQAARMNPIDALRTE
jgi:putative ABC transport system permease protein